MPFNKKGRIDMPTQIAQNLYRLSQQASLESRPEPGASPDGFSGFKIRCGYITD